VLAQCQTHRIDVILPIAEPALLAILEAGSRFAGYRCPWPDLSLVLCVQDKARVLAAAPAAGIAIPAQTEVQDRAAALALEVGALAYPVVMKPSRSVGGAAAARVKLSVRHAASATELRRELAAMPEAAFPLLLQQRIIGPGIGIFLLRWEGRTSATFAHRRLREKPPSGGASVFRESIAADPALVACSERLLDHFGWSGVAMIEYKVDSATGTPFLMEINGRFWGSLQLAIDAGVDFPALLVSVATGAAHVQTPPYRVGVRSRWWWGDVDHLLARLRHSPAELALPPGASTRAQVVRDFLRCGAREDRGEVLRWDDPLPFFAETLAWLRGR